MKKTATTLLIIFFAFSSNFLKAQTQVTFYTSMGTFVASMYDVARPITTGNFIGLVNNHFYDGIIFHRVISGFMIQGGDPTGTGSGGSGVTIPDELTPPNNNLQKVLAMANAGPNTGTSQFFINLVNNTYLNPNYPVFGIVITNFSVVQAIGVVPTDANDRPLTDVVMDSVRVTFTPSGISEINKPLFETAVFPNPVSEQGIISINSIKNTMVNIAIYNQLGERIYSDTKNIVAGINNISFEEINAKPLAQGMYYLIVNDGNSSTKSKFTIAGRK